MSDELFYFNGVNASTGAYLSPPMNAQELAQLARGETKSIEPDHLADLRDREAKKKSHLGVKAGVDPRDLAQTGWGVIFARDTPPAVRDALTPLLEFRKAQANQIKERYHEYIFQPEESKNAFLVRNGVGIGAVDPDKMPYYLLIVGDPEKIPYTFQYQLDVAYAVGRLHLDTPDDYALYAQSVVRAERDHVTRGKHAAFFGVANANDFSTQASANNLVKPLAAKLGAAQPDWTFDTWLAEAATKTRLEDLLREQAPALLFTASHGAAFDLGDSRQMKHQGALICQEWDPQAMQGKPLPQSMYYAMDDVTEDARVHGMISFHFACFGAGTPREDEYSETQPGMREAKQIAPYAFVAKLPKKLLAHPKGGALAVAGHIDRAWGASFLWNENIEQLGAFESAFKQLLDGYPIGAAMEFFNARYAELATSLSGDLAALKVGKRVDPKGLGTEWAATNDARGYAVLGDPAVRLNTGENGSAPQDADTAKTFHTLTLADAPTPTAPPALPESASFAVTNTAPEAAENSKTDLSLQATLDKMEQQIAALAETLKEIRAALQSK